MSRGTSISETGARHRTTEEYRRMLSEECTTIEENISRHQKVLADLQSDIRLAERRVKGLTTMVDNLEKSKAEKEALLSAAEQDLKANKGDAEQLAAQVKSLEKELAGINRQLADKQEKLQTADRQLAELKENMDAIEERTGNSRRKPTNTPMMYIPKWTRCSRMSCWKMWSASIGTYRHRWTWRNGNCSTARSSSP